MDIKTDSNDDLYARLGEAAEKNGLDVVGGRVRRSSSRFCFGVEHGDYNGMELFGVGTDRFIWLAFKPNDLGRVRIFSENFPQDGIVDFALGEDCDPEALKDSWERFPRGVEAILRREGYELGTGFDAVLYGNIPGGGMSRSASLALNLILTFFEVNGIEDDGSMRVVNLAQMVENDFIGSPCGKLDQIMIYYSREGMGTYFRPVDETVEHIPFGGDADAFRIVSLDTGTKRPGLEKSTYKIRVDECAAMKKLLKEKLGMESLAEISQPGMYEKALACLEEAGLKTGRLKYLYEAQARFAQTLEAWRKGDIEQVGANFRADGYGLRDDYEISGPELETMCDIARTVDGVLGERMLGGGDKGASGALIRKEVFDALREEVEKEYPRLHPDFLDEFAIHSCRTVDGITCEPFQQILQTP
ncbi:MAG: galactokinase [Luteolibacter sp.]